MNNDKHIEHLNCSTIYWHYPFIRHSKQWCHALICFCKLQSSNLNRHVYQTRSCCKQLNNRHLLSTFTASYFPSSLYQTWYVCRNDYVYVIWELDFPSLQDSSFYWTHSVKQKPWQSIELFIALRSAHNCTRKKTIYGMLPYV